MSDERWTDVAISMVLRIGVLSSVAIIAVGLALIFIHHPDYRSSPEALGRLTSPGVEYPNTLVSVVDGVSRFRGQAIVMAGLLLLIRRR